MDTRRLLKGRSLEKKDKKAHKLQKFAKDEYGSEWIRFYSATMVVAFLFRYGMQAMCVPDDDIYKRRS